MYKITHASSNMSIVNYVNLVFGVSLFILIIMSNNYYFLFPNVSLVSSSNGFN